MCRSAGLFIFYEYPRYLDSFRKTNARCAPVFPPFLSLPYFKISRSVITPASIS